MRRLKPLEPTLRVPLCGSCGDGLEFMPSGLRACSPKHSSSLPCPPACFTELPKVSSFIGYNWKMQVECLGLQVFPRFLLPKVKLWGQSNCGRLFLTMVPVRISRVPLPAFLPSPRKQVMLTAVVEPKHPQSLE